MTALAELTGFADGPPLEPSERFVESVRELGQPLGIDAMELLTERAAIWSYSRNGRISCGGATRLMATADGWIALSLTRADDEDLVPAWIGSAPCWDDIQNRVASRSSLELVDRGRLLGLPIAALGERAAGPTVQSARLGDADPLDSPPVVVDLSSLWA